MKEQQNINTPSQVNYEYQRPPFWKKLFASILDFIILLVLSVAFFIPIRAIVTNSSSYVKLEETISTYKEETKLYEKNNGKLVDVVTFMDETLDFYSSLEQKNFYIERIDYFINYISQNVSADVSNSIQNEYDKWRLNDNNFNGNPYFVLNNDIVVQNPNYTIGDDIYVKNIYEPYIQNYLLGHFVNDIPAVREAMIKEGNYLLFLEIPVSYSLALLLTFIIPPIIFRRNRSTIGKLVYKIGLVDKNLLSVKSKTYITRSLLFFFLEGMLSIYTFGIPLLITFSMSVFGKKGQGFADYMTSIEEIDLNSGTIFHSKEEALIYSMENHKKAVEFKLKK